MEFHRSMFWFLLFLASSIINLVWCDCLVKLERCGENFRNEMKSIKFSTANKEYQKIYFDVCSQNGIYDRFVRCVQELQDDCDQMPQFRKQICETRAIKLASYRYTWKYNLIHDVCYRTLTIFDSDFFKHEKCISEVINTRKWICDELHHTKVKSLNGPEVCHHWNDFRQCTQNEIVLHCGDMAAKISDYLFHSHNSYFTKYLRCNFTGEPFTRCWYDWILERLPPKQIPTITTQIPTTTISTTTTLVSTTTTVAPSTAAFTETEEEFATKGQEPTIVLAKKNNKNNKQIESKNRMLNPTDSTPTNNNNNNNRIFLNDSDQNSRPTNNNINNIGLSKLIRESKAISTAQTIAAADEDEELKSEKTPSLAQASMVSSSDESTTKNRNPTGNSATGAIYQSKYQQQKSLFAIFLFNMVFFLLSTLI